jgi:hypothetical protein
MREGPTWLREVRSDRTRARGPGYPHSLPPVIARERMTLTQIFKAGVAAGSEPCGVYAVYSEGQKSGSVIDAEGRYTGQLAVTTPSPFRAVRLDNELLPAAVYDAFKAAIGKLDLEQALARVHALGRDEAA